MPNRFDEDEEEDEEGAAVVVVVEEERGGAGETDVEEEKFSREISVEGRTMKLPSSSSRKGIEEEESLSADDPWLGELSTLGSERRRSCCTSFPERCLLQGNLIASQSDSCYDNRGLEKFIQDRGLRGLKNSQATIRVPGVLACALVACVSLQCLCSLN